VTNSTAVSTTSAPTVADPLLDIPGLPTLYHEDCATPYPNGTSTTCASSISTVGIPQTFNMSDDVVPSDAGIAWTGVLHEQLFAFQLNESASVQFTFRDTDLGGYTLVLDVYQSAPGINFSDLQGLVHSGTLELVTNSTTSPK
jgi:hypothetical protein